MKKKKLWIALLVAFVVLAASVVYLNRAVIFQRGNPIPYLTAAARISEKNPYVAVDEAKGIYISKRGECPELLEYYQEKYGTWMYGLNRLGAATCLLMGAEMK